MKGLEDKTKHPTKQRAKRQKSQKYKRQENQRVNLGGPIHVKQKCQKDNLKRNKGV